MKTMKIYLTKIIAIIFLLTFNCCEEEEKLDTNFIADKTEVLTNEIIQFSDLTENNPENWHWEFGDEATSTLQNPQHSYKFAGNYTVKLATTNDKISGNSKTKKRFYYCKYGNRFINRF